MSEICETLLYDNEGGEKFDDAKLGKVLKEGTIYFQDQSEEWVQCYIIVRERGLILAPLLTQDVPQKKAKTAMHVVMDFSSPNEVDIVMLPDNARRSRESKLFPFTVQRKTMEVCNEQAVLDPKIYNDPVFCMDDRDDGIAKSISRGVNVELLGNDVILATSNGREMWEWASCIQWLGTNPKEKKISRPIEPDCIAMHSQYYEDSQVLQDALIEMFTYKNLPQSPVRFEDIARINQEPGYRGSLLNYISYPDDFPSRLDPIEDQQKSDDSIIKTTIDPGESPIVENPPQLFGVFAYLVLVGACVHVNEKCFELITSSNLYDVSSIVTWKGNSPFSMLCEGQYSSARNYMIQVLFRLGYPRLEGYYGGHSCSNSFSRLLAKPSDMWLGVGAATGQPVHPDDQKLCQYLLEKGDGKYNNKKLSDDLIKASKVNMEVYKAEPGQITAVIIPKSIMGWGCTVLTKLDISQNGIFELPEEFYDFTALTDLNLSRNCLFGLSHKLGNMTKLKQFYIGQNLIEELPYTIENLNQIVNFNCQANPIIKPPIAVWTRGIAAVRNYYKDIRESGTEINVDLRVLVLGLSEAGKTSLVNGLINPNATSLTRVGDRTVGIEKRTWVMNRSNNEQPINMLTYDFAGQEEYYITHHLFLGSNALYMIAFDLSKYKPNLLDDQIMLWWDSIQNRVCNVKSNASKTPKVILVGTHSDMIDNAQDCADNIHRSLQDRFHLRMESLNECLKRLEEELENLDPRRSKGSSRDDEERKEKEYDTLTNDKKIQIFMLEGEAKKLSHQQQCTISLPTKIQAVSSKDLCNFDKLKEQIALSLTETSESGRYFPYLDVPVPGSWFQVRRFVRQKSAQKGYECMKLPQYFKLLSKELNINEDIGYRATLFCHDLGDVLFFEKEGLVFLQPSFLIDMFKCVIRHDHRESTNWTTDLQQHNISKEDFSEGKDLLLQKGELQEWLLEVLWSQLYCGLLDRSITNNLIHLLETFDIATAIERDGHKCLLIPEFQPQFLTVKWPRQKNADHFEAQRWICTDKMLPQGLLKRIQVRMFKKVFKRGAVETSNLSQNEIYTIDENSTILYCKRCNNNEDCPGLQIYEHIRMHIRGPDKQCVMSLLTKMYSCLENTLKDYPGILFDHYVVHTIQNGSSFHKLEEVKAMQAAGESKILASIRIPNRLRKEEFDTEEELVEIDDLLSSSEIQKYLHKKNLRLDSKKY